MSDSVNFNILLKQKTRSLYKEIFRKSIHLCSGLIPTLLDIAYYPIIILLVLAIFQLLVKLQKLLQEQEMLINLFLGL